jgi:hypothetical protein
MGGGSSEKNAREKNGAAIGGEGARLGVMAWWFPWMGPARGTVAGAVAQRRLEGAPPAWLERPTRTERAVPAMPHRLNWLSRLPAID